MNTSLIDSVHFDTRPTPGQWPSADNRRSVYSPCGTELSTGSAHFSVRWQAWDHIVRRL